MSRPKPFRAGGSRLGSEQPLLNSELLGYGRDPLPPVKDGVTADGDVVVPINAEAWGALPSGFQIVGLDADRRTELAKTDKHRTASIGRPRPLPQLVCDEVDESAELRRLERSARVRRQRSWDRSGFLRKGGFLAHRNPRGSGDETEIRATQGAA